MSNASFKMNGVEVFSENAQVVSTGAGFPAGHIVGFEKYESSTVVNSSSTTWTSAISGAFTPKYNNSLILILFNALNGGATNNSFTGAIRLMRNASEIDTTYVKNISVNAPDYNGEYTTKIFYDTPNSTSQLTYDIQIRRHYFSGTYGGTFSVFENDEKGTLIIMEIKQ
jgi:hypothetical protein